ncbi:MAG: hypothetical protein ACTSWY_09850 [Promethearchaeota archaeon]
MNATNCDSDYDFLEDNDTDFDTLTDGVEVLLFDTNPLNPDSDGDGLSDYEEIIPGEDGYITNPKNKDTEGDGQTDGQEASWGTDPTDPNSRNELFWQIPLIAAVMVAIIGAVLYRKMGRRGNI